MFKTGCTFQPFHPLMGSSVLRKNQQKAVFWQHAPYDILKKIVAAMHKYKRPRQIVRLYKSW